MRNCLILGSGRSGTSMVAGTLAKAGYFMGERLYRPRPSNPKGFFEDVEVNAVNEAILAPLTPRALPRFRPGRLYRLLRRTLFSHGLPDGGRWLARLPVEAALSSSPEVTARIQRLVGRTPYCFKDPRFCYTLPVWRPWLQNTRFVCVFRDPSVSAMSMLREAQTTPKLAGTRLTLGDCLEVWRLMYTHILEIHCHEGSWLFLHYDQVLAGDGIDRLATFLEVDPDRGFPEPALSRTESGGPIPESVCEVYDQLWRRAYGTGIATTEDNRPAPGGDFSSRCHL